MGNSWGVGIWFRHSLRRLLPLELCPSSSLVEIKLLKDEKNDVEKEKKKKIVSKYSYHIDSRIR